MAAVLVHAQQLCDGQAPHLAHDEHIQPAIIRLRLRPGAETAAVGAAVADGTHQTVHRKGLTVDGVLHPAADVPAQLLHNGQQIGHLPAAQRDAPEFGDAVGHLRVQPGSTDGGRQAEVGLHQVDGHRPARQLGIQVQKLLPRPKGAQEVIAAAIGQAAHGGACKAIGPGEGLVEGAVAARRENAQRLPCLLCPGCGSAGQLPRMSGVGGDADGIFLRGKACPGSCSVDLLRQLLGAVGLASGGVQKKQGVHVVPPAILLLL